MQNAEGTEVVDLRQSDRVRLFVTSLLQVFRGDRDALGKHYRVRYSPVENDDARWQLELVPEQEQLKPILKRLVLHGKGRGVERIDTAHRLVGLGRRRGRLRRGECRQRRLEVALGIDQKVG